MGTSKLSEPKTKKKTQPGSTLKSLTPKEQVMAGKLPRRLVQLVIGLALYGFSMAAMIKGALGLDPWDVFHQGLAHHIPLSFGTITIIVGCVVLLLWIPLKQMPGVGTIANTILIGLFADLGLTYLPAAEVLWMQLLYLLGGIVVNGLAGAIYIGAQLGPGPRDGLMTGFARRTGKSLRLIRTIIELTVLVLGWILGGSVGIGTVLYAVSIGPLVQFFLRFTTVQLDVPQVTEKVSGRDKPAETS